MNDSTESVYRVTREYIIKYISSMFSQSALEVCGADHNRTICYNNGSCVNGTCVCPAEYTGPSCIDYVCECFTTTMMHVVMNE